MKPAAGKLLLITLGLVSLPLLLAPAGQAAPPPQSPAVSSPAPAPAQRGTYDLLAHGNANALWVAEVVPNNDALSPGMRTSFRYRTPGDGANWRALGEVAARVVALSDRGAELLILLENGDWMMVSDSGARTGASLPGQGNILAIAGDANNVWAIGEDLRPPPPSPSPAAPATVPAISPATITVTTTATAAAAAGNSTLIDSTTRQAPRSVTTSTAPSLLELGLFKLERGGWVHQSNLPAGIRANDIAAMTLIDQRPLLAVVGARDQQLRLYSFNHKEWSDATSIATLPPDADVDLLSLGGRPIVTITDPSAASTTIHVGGAKWSPAIKLQPSPETANIRHRAAAAGLGQLRLLAASGPGKLIEQPYNENDGSLAGKATQSTPQSTFSTDKLAFALQVLAMIVLLVVMLGTFRRRGAIQQAARHLDQLHVAPLSHRFAAGLIDAVPLFIAFVLASPDSPTPAAARNLTAIQLTWAAFGLAVYVLHTTVGELFVGRTIGKVLFGLRVVNLDGNRAGAGAILIRNALRIVDVILTFPLMLMILLMIFLPLHQRLGDLAAGTLVIRDQAPELEEDEENPSD